MATKVVYAPREDKQELRKQLGCMNGIFQLFDRRYLLGLHRQNQNRLSPGEGENGFKNSSEKAKEKNPKKVTIEKSRASVESSRNSFSSSCSSTTFSSLDGSKRVQTEWQLASEPTSPNKHKKQQDWPVQLPDIRDVVKDSMTREIRVVSVRNVAKDERAGHDMKHIDSPRPFLHQKSIQYNRKDRNLAKVQETSLGVRKVKETSRYSCDERESQYSMKSTLKVKEIPRLSLDSKQMNSMKESRSLLMRRIQGSAETDTSSSKTLNQTQEPGSNKRPSSGVVARLMGLESLTDSINEVETFKNKPSLNDELVSSTRWSSKVEEFNVSVSPRMHKDPATPERRFGKVPTRVTTEPALQKQEGGDRGSKQPPLKNKVAPVKAKNASPSVYGEMEKRLSALEFKTSAKDLRALKQILEAMQTTRGLQNKEQSLQSQKSDQPFSPTIKGASYPRRQELLDRTMKPAKMSTDSLMIAGLHNLEHADRRKDAFRRKQAEDPTPRNKKATGRRPRSLSPSNSQEYLTGGKPVLSPKLQGSKNGIDKQCFHGPSSDSSRIKKQSNVHPVISGLTTRNPKSKPTYPLEKSEQSCRYSIERRNPSQDDDTVSFKAEINTSSASQNKMEVNRNDQPKENHRVNENNFADRLIEEKAMIELAKLTMEQPSPVSVLDAFYIEDAPSPIKKKPNAFNDYENLHFQEKEKNQVGIYNLVNSADMNQCSEFKNVKLESIDHLVHQIELLNSTDDDATVNETAESTCKTTNEDHRYISEILSASGLLKDVESATRVVQLHPTDGLIKPELFHLLEKARGNTELTDDGCHKRSKSNEKIRRLMIFDSVNDILFHKLAKAGSSGMWTGKRRGRPLNGEKLMKEVCSDIDHLQFSSDRCLSDEDDEVKKLVSADVDKKSEEWDKCSYEIPGVVLDIERLIFKDLIDEVVNAKVAILQQRSGRHHRQLFPM